ESCESVPIKHCGGPSVLIGSRTLRAQCRTFRRNSMRFSAMGDLAGVVWDDLGAALSGNDNFVWFVPASVARDEPLSFSPDCGRLLIRSNRDPLRKLVLLRGIFSFSPLPRY